MNYHFDIKSIRDNPQAFTDAMKSRGHNPNTDKILEYDENRRGFLSKQQQAQSALKDFSADIGAAIKSGNHKKADELKAVVAKLKDDIKLYEHQANSSELVLNGYLLQCPNIAADDVPDGVDEKSNVEVRNWGVILPKNSVPHYDLDLQFGMDTAAKISGSRFSMLMGPVARLHRALGQFMLDSHRERGFLEVIPPVIVNKEALFGTGQLPKFKDDLFGIANSEDAFATEQYLIPTAEVSLTNIHADEILLGMHRYVALTDCFRSEAGSAGRDTRGLIRQHQFQKVELVSICKPEQSVSEHDYMLNAAEQILARLDLPYRTMLLCKGDMGFSAQKTYDIEVWLPGQQAYREISSVSNCGDFQARRMNTRYKVDGHTVFAHTLNGSGLAVGRTLVAVLENYQDGGEIRIPEVLRPYLENKFLLSELD